MLLFGSFGRGPVHHGIEAFPLNLACLSPAPLSADHSRSWILRNGTDTKYANYKRRYFGTSKSRSKVVPMKGLRLAVKVSSITNAVKPAFGTLYYTT
jgi:hypothetical protein